MTMMSELKNQEIGLIQLVSMGFKIYLKNLKPILLVFYTIYLPFLIIDSFLTSETKNNPSELFWVYYSIFVIVASLAYSIYFIAISVITENYVSGRNSSYRSVVEKIFVLLIPLFILELRFSINYLLRCLLLLIPGIIYLINNQYYRLAFILRKQKGKAAFAYSQSIVQGNWWRVFWLIFLLGLTSSGLQIIFSKFLNIFLNDFLIFILSHTLPEFIVIGINIANTLLFLNLDFQKEFLEGWREQISE